MLARIAVRSQGAASRTAVRTAGRAAATDAPVAAPPGAGIPALATSARAGDSAPARGFRTGHAAAAGNSGDGFQHDESLGRLRNMPGMGGPVDEKKKKPEDLVHASAMEALEEGMRAAKGKDAGFMELAKRRALLKHFAIAAGDMGAEDEEGEAQDGQEDHDSDEDPAVFEDPRWDAILEGNEDVGMTNVFEPLSIIDGSINYSQDDDAEGPPFRQPRPTPGPLKAGAERRLSALRDSPIAKAAPAFLDYLEHEAWIDRYRDGDSGGAFMDRTIAPWDEFCEEDAFYRNVLTDDEYNVPEDYEEPVYVPDRIRSQIYFQWAYKGLSIGELAQRYKLRSERVAAFILFKRTEPEYLARGMANYDNDRLMEGLYGAEAQGKTPLKDWDGDGDDHDAGLDVALLRDAQVPEDCFPVMKFRGNRLRGAFPTHTRPPIPVKERKFHSRYAIRDVSSGDGFPEQRRARHIVVDYDGERRPATKREELARGNRLRRAYPKRVGYGKFNLPFEDIELDQAA